MLVVSDVYVLNNVGNRTSPCGTQVLNLTLCSCFMS